ncbi:phosphatidate cytidylyltransferase [Sphingomonas mollis]|uniref:Phosphatidate cytidylyltransferase n=1 Tax=Sphingomonas mollis TaxID=2795726 RepID=A0ABS0XMB5_9SPHN|nr:phosphatidate cytidylyltransferase [Sphingomonas sp. BT553]MBJ6121182.1 phosphatidate cytidylyltransferase [Sphingomonas sp. BT553]
MPDTPDAKLRTPSNLRLRMIASVVMIAVALVALVAGDFLFWLLAVVAALFMMAEWADLHGADAKTKRMAQFALSVPLAIMAPIAAGPHFFVLGLLGAAFFFIAIVHRNAGLAFGAAYVGLPVFALLLIRQQPDGLVLTLWALALVWATDIGAFFTGRSLGGPKLAPRISPAKTWSGLIGGVVLATIFAFALHVGSGLPFRLVIATPFLAVLAQGGDLYESALKRRAGMKDSGNVLPGHGGVLDRLDGIVPVAPVAALLVVLPQLFG